ncbi:hypothetical protein ACPDHN_10960 [Myroides odoratimimus]|uniref:hypothetical protein n=1 Tax=Myroides odoratimimus TaxID=76832 RepID=UPI0029C0920A|nr:hypothetical protein [Myroides odoratimimus]MDX4975386.1 hypothetical protein [Myroides odoratimimus]
MLVVGKPYINIIGEKVRLSSIITEDSVEKEVWIEFDSIYEQYVCGDRIDSFVVALLKYAMLHKHNIVSESCIGSELYYQLKEYLIPNMVTGNKELSEIEIVAPIDFSRIVNEGAVGTGISCGIDSLHAIATHSAEQINSYKVTHLTFNNVGSHGEGDRAEKLYEERKQRAISYANEYGYSLILSDSNIHNVFEQVHYYTHTFTSMFPVLALQKLYSIYLYASSAKLSDFTLNSKTPGRYEYLILNSISTNDLKIYSQGANCSRHKKTADIADFEPSYKYLNVCTEENNNCSKCEKCLRTLFSLDYLGILNKYESVFDLKVFKENRKRGFRLMVYRAVIENDTCYKELFSFFKEEIPLSLKIEMNIRRVLSSFVPDSIFKFFQKIKNARN